MSSKSPNTNKSTNTEPVSSKIDDLRKALIKGEHSGTANYDCESFIKKLDSDSKDNKPKYILDGLLEKCDLNAPQNNELEEWDKTKPTGREII
jgi:hypothetical protein